jgi:hypothetical protein
MTVDKMSFYEQVGLVIPGTVLLFGLLFYFPALNGLLTKDGISVGQLGIFVLLAYAAGHLIAAGGNLLENLLWRLFGGMPTNWVTRSEPGILTPQQIALMQGKARSRFGVALEGVVGMSHKVWFPLTRQMYADVAKNGKPERIDTVNGNYGLNRGLCVATLALAIIAAIHWQWWVFIGLLAASVVYAYRAYRFGVHYARELYVQFLVLTDTPVTVELKPKG